MPQPQRLPAGRGRRMMADYTFSTIKLVPNAARGESVNIGILLYDPVRKLLHRRLTDNWDEVRRRAGVGSLPDLGAVSGDVPARVGDDYLATLAENSLGGIVVTAPRPLMPFDTHLDALEWVFRSQIGVPGCGKGAAEADAVLAGLVAEAKFPRGSFRRGHKFGRGDTLIRFPYVFGRGDRPSAAMFAVSLSDAHALARIKERLYDILSIREWHGDGIEFTMFAVQRRRDIDPRDDGVRNGLGMLDERRVGVVYMDGIRDALGRIRRLVA